MLTIVGSTQELRIRPRTPTLQMVDALVYITSAVYVPSPRSVHINGAAGHRWLELRPLALLHVSERTLHLKS